VDRYLAAVTDPARSVASVGRLLHPEFTFREWPNAINPAGSERDRETALRALAASRTMLAEHAFEVHEHVVQGDTVASRMTWRGRLAIDAGPLKAGMDLTAHVSQHTTVRDGLNWRTESFDCYEPWRPPEADQG